MRAGVLVVSLCCAVAHAAAAPKSEVEAIAKKVVADQSKKLDFDEKLALKERLQRFDFKNANQPKVAHDLASEAAVLGATGANPALALALCGSAIRYGVDDAHVVSNFGELLHLAKLTREAAAVLTYARTLSPKSPVVITNLANVLFELGRQKEAERAWRDAIALDEKYGPAHEGLVALYLARRDIPHAIEELFKASQWTYVPSMSNAVTQIQMSGSSATIPPPPAAAASAGQSGQSRPRVGPGDRLIIPDLPNWPDRMAFVASLQGMQPMIEDITTGGLGGSLAFAERYYGGAGQGAPNHPLSRQPLFELELLNMYLADQLKKALAPYQSKGETASKKMAQGIQQAGDAWIPKIQEATARGDYQAARVAMANCSKAGRVVADKFFAEWRDATRASWSKAKEALELYWVYSDGILGRIYDQPSFDFAQQVRVTTVKVSLLPFAVGMTSQLTGMAMADVMCLAPADSAPPVPGPQPTVKLELPSKQKEKCPIEGLPSIGVGVASLSVNCESWELEAGEGVIGKVKRNFKTGATTIGIGPGIEGDFIGIKVGAKVLVNVSFDGEGRCTGFSVEPSAGISLTGKDLVSGGVGVGTAVNVDLQGHVTIDKPTTGFGIGTGGESPEEPTTPMQTPR